MNLRAFVLLPVLLLVSSGSLQAQPRTPTLLEQARAWAPDIYQDTDDSYPAADLLTAIDFDGDRVANNNWESLPRYSYQTLLSRGVVSWWGSRTRTHDFLGYAFFHPRDWEDHQGIVGRLDWLGRRVFNLRSQEHENDLEGVLLVVPRGRGPSQGGPLLLVTQAHNHFFQYGPDVLWRDRLDDIDGPIQRDPLTGRVQIFLEAKGHGAYGTWRKTNLDAHRGDGVLYTRGGSTLSRRRRGATTASYRLRSITPWWNRFKRIPYGGRDATFTRVGGKDAFRGETFEDDAARPPWSWRDADYPRTVNRQFFRQPARFVRRILTIRGRAFSVWIRERSFSLR